jgi:hypothetical protein
MTAEQFAYWMQGFVELNGAEPTAEQWQSIKEHLSTVFVKLTPAVQVPGGNRTFVPPPVYGPVVMPDFSKVNWPLDQVQITC